MEIELQPRMARLYRAFQYLGKDVSVAILYVATFQEDIQDIQSAHKRLGPYIFRLNRKLRKIGLNHRIVLGSVPRTYQLIAAKSK